MHRPTSARRDSCRSRQRRLSGCICALAAGAAWWAPGPGHAQTRPPPPAQLPVITVKAAREEVTTRAEAPNPVVVITRAEIENTNDLTLGDFLRRQPGISFSGPAGNIKDIRMRGLDKGYTQILVDGDLWLGSTQERQIQVDQLPMSMIERVEIIRSPLPDLPSDGIGGTINIVLRRADNAEFNIKTGLGRTWGTQGSRPLTSLQVNYARSWDDGLTLVLPVNFNRRHELKTKPKVTENFDAGTGVRTALLEELEVETNRVDEFTLGPRLTWQVDAIDTVTASAFANVNDGDKTKMVTKWRSESPEEGGSFVGNGSGFETEDKDRTTVRLAFQLQRKLASDLTGTLGAVTQRATEDKHKNTPEDTTVHAASRRLYWHARYAGQPLHQWSTGVELHFDERHDRKTPSSKREQFDVEETRMILFVRDDWQLAPAHLLVPGFRAEARSTTSLDQDQVSRNGGSDALNPSVAYRWDFARNRRLRAALARTLRPPKFEQLSSVTIASTGTNSSLNPDTTGNPDLRPERAWGYDLGIEGDIQGRTALAALNFSQRFIADVAQEQTDLVDGRFVKRPVNIPGTSTTRSIELDGRADLRALGLRHITVLGNYSRFFSRQAGTNEPLKDQPHYVANTGMDWRVRRWDTLFGWRFNYQGEIRKSGGETESPQRLLDAFAYWDIDATWSLRVSGSNLLDTRKTKYKPTYTAGTLTALVREQESGGRSLLFTLEARL